MVRVVLLANLNHAEIDYALYIEVAMIVDTLLMCVRIHLWLHAPGLCMVSVNVRYLDSLCRILMPVLHNVRNHLFSWSTLWTDFLQNESHVAMPISSLTKVLVMTSQSFGWSILIASFRSLKFNHYRKFQICQLSINDEC